MTDTVNVWTEDETGVWTLRTLSHHERRLLLIASRPEDRFVDERTRDMYLRYPQPPEVK